MLFRSQSSMAGVPAGASSPGSRQELAVQLLDVPDEVRAATFMPHPAAVPAIGISMPSCGWQSDKPQSQGSMSMTPSLPTLAPRDAARTDAIEPASLNRNSKVRLIGPSMRRASAQASFARPLLATPLLQVVHRVITRHLLGQAGFKADEAGSGAGTLIQRFGSAAKLNIHLHCLVLGGVYRHSADGAPEFVELVRAGPRRLLGGRAQSVAAGLRVGDAGAVGPPVPALSSAETAFAGGDSHEPGTPRANPQSVVTFEANCPLAWPHFSNVSPCCDWRSLDFFKGEIT